jgi:hypothetical protein
MTKLFFMKKSFRNSLPVVIAALSFLFSFTSLPDKVNFSGEWNLNKNKSDLGQFADYATRIIKADQKADMISISRTSNSFTGEEVTTMETLPFDGKETESTIFGNSKKKTTVKWSDDGQAFTMTYTMFLDFNGQTTEIKGVETWTLSDGGKTLISQNNSSSSFGDLATKAVYEKK